MAISKEQKTQILKDLIEKMKQAQSVSFVKYANIPVKNQEILRNNLREKEGELKIAKKTLIKLAAKEIGIKEFNEEDLEGQIAVVFSYTDPITAPQEIKKAAKNSEFVLVSGIVDGKILNKSAINALANLPAKEVIAAQFLGACMAPVQGFTSCCSGVMGGFVRVLNAYKEKLDS